MELEIICLNINCKYNNNFNILIFSVFANGKIGGIEEHSVNKESRHSVLRFTLEIEMQNLEFGC